MSDRHRLEDFYTPYYRESGRHDSPDRSRVEMARSVVNAIVDSGEPQNVLDVGAGRADIFGSILRNTYRPEVQELVDRSRFFAVDIAEIGLRQRIKPGSIFHVQADSRQLPFREGAFGVIFSNLSIDMLRRNGNGDYEQALKEVYRVAKGGAAIKFNFHPSGLFDKLSREYIQVPSSGSGQDRVLRGYFTGDAADNPFYSDEQTIREELTEAGLAVGPVVLTNNASGRLPATDEWWKASAIKPASGQA